MLAEWIADVFPLIRSRLVDAPPQAGESAQRMRDLLAGPEALSRREKPVQRARPLARDELTVPEPLDEDEWAAVRKCVTLRNAEQERQFEGVLFRGANRVPWSQVPVDDFGEREAVRCFLLLIRRTGELLDLKNRLAADEFGLGPGARLRRLVEDALALDGYEPRCA